MNREQLLTQIQAVNLIAVDLHLFLDTHPDNTQALKDYQAVSKQYQTLKEQYEEKFGPLVSFGHQSPSSRFSWVDEPWPWKNK